MPRGAWPRCVAPWTAGITKEWMMFEHLDDPAPLAPTSRTFRAVLSRAARLRRQRIVSGFAVVGVVTLAVGLVIGLTVPRPHPAEQAIAFNSHVGSLATGT